MALSIFLVIKKSRVSLILIEVLSRFNIQGSLFVNSLLSLMDIPSVYNVATISSNEKDRGILIDVDRLIAVELYI